METLIAHVEKVLQDEDVEGLIEMGAPSDEYSEEAEQIAKAIKKLPIAGRTIEQTVAIIALVWARAFNCDDLGIRKRMPAFQRVAQKIGSTSAEL